MVLGEAIALPKFPVVEVLWDWGIELEHRHPFPPMTLSSYTDSALGDLAASVTESSRSNYWGGSDRNYSLSPAFGANLSEQMLRAIYRHSWLLRRVCDLYADDPCSVSPQLSIVDGTPEDVARVMSRYNDITGLNADDQGQGGDPGDELLDDQESGDSAFTQAQRLANIFGSAYVVGVFNGEDDPFRPIERVRDVRSLDDLIVLDCYQLRPQKLPNGSFEYYQVLARSSTHEAGKLIHKSRVLEFWGSWLPPYDYWENGGRHDSLMTPIWDTYLSSEDIKSNVQSAIRSFSIFSLGIQGLSEMLLAPNGMQVIKNHLQTVIQNLKVHGVLLTDPALDNGEFKGRSFGGVKENWEKFVEELTASTGVPYYKLWGRVGRAGLADDGGAEAQAWEEAVAKFRTTHITPNHRRLFKWLFAAELGRVPKNWKLTYAPLYQPSQMQQAEVLEKKVGAIVQLASIPGAISGEEVREHFATGVSLETVLQQSRSSPRTDAQMMNPTPGILLTAQEWERRARVTEDDILKAIAHNNAQPPV